jgi:beta-glucosidase
MVRLSAALAAAISVVLAQNSSLPDSPLTNATSPPKYPAPWGEGLGEWAESYERARAFVSQLTLLEKVNRK